VTYTPITPGTINWDVPVNAAFTSQDSRITSNEGRLNGLESKQVIGPSDAGWIAWNYDPATAQGSTTLTTGQMFMSRLDIRSSATAVNAIYALNAVGVTLTSGQNLVGLYDSSGNLLATSADQSANWLSTGLKVTAFTSSVSIAAGTYHLGFLSNGATPMSLLRSMATSAQNATVNLGFSASAARWATTGAGLTALPTPVTMSGRAASFGSAWAALS